MTYEEALAEYKERGASRCSDAAAMAAYCENTIHYTVGAVSGRLVWEGAMKQNMTHMELATLSVKDPMEVSDLMWL